MTPPPAPPTVGVDVPAPDFVVQHFPGLVQAQLFEVAAWQWLALGLALILAVIFGLLLSRLAVYALRRVDAKPHSAWATSLGLATQRPLFILVALAFFDAGVDWIDLVGRVSVVVDVIIRQLLIAGSAWLVIASAGSLVETTERNLSGQDEFLSRGSRTQLLVAHRIFSALVVLVAGALALSSFAPVRKLGVSLLASAGIASVVLGIAAQKTLGTLLAGLQLSLSQPIRLGDTVIWEGEFGTVEEIRLTYVVLRLWDRRRMIAPVGKFLENSFQNWTKVKTNLLGSVELWADYATPLAPLREALTGVLTASKLWDKEVNGLVVLDTTDKAIKLRALMSAANAGDLFDLRCEVREKLITRLQTLEGGKYLPAGRNLNWDGDPKAS